jgi:hypothetical protein
MNNNCDMDIDDIIPNLKMKLCVVCNKNIVSRNYASHTYTASHKKNVKKLESNMDILPDEETINLQNIKVELLEIKINIEQLIIKIDKIKNKYD